MKIGKVRSPSPKRAPKAPRKLRFPTASLMLWAAMTALVSAMAPMASPLQRANPQRGNVARRPQTTARAGHTFQESTAKYWMNVFTVSGIAFGTASVQQPFKAVPGYISRLRVKIVASGGTGAAAVASADAPDNVIQMFYLRDASGYPVITLDGTALRAHSMIGGQVGPGPYTDPHQRPSFSAMATTGNFTVTWDVNLELGGYGGFGCIAGASQSRVPSIQINLNPAATVYSTLPTGVPTLAVQVDAEFYGAPLDDPSKAPPGNGSSVQWTQAPGANGISSGSNVGVIVPAPNLTGYLCTLGVIARNSLNAREDGWLTGTNDVELWIDQQLRIQETFDMAADRMARHFGLGLGSPFPARLVGLLAYTFRDAVLPAGPVGIGGLALAEPTDTGTLIELRSGAWGTITSGPDTLTFITQRVYPSGEVPEEPQFI